VPLPWLALLVLWSLLASPARADAPPAVNLPPSVLRAPPAPDLPPGIRARLAALDYDLRRLGAQGGSRVLQGGLQLAIGAGLATAGALVKDDIARAVLLLASASAVANGTIQLTLVPDTPDLARAYLKLPATTLAEARDKIHMGARTLGELARAGRRTRIVDGTVTMAIACAYVPLVYTLARRDDPAYRFGDTAFDYVALALSGIQFATGLVGALVPSEAERRAQAYRALDARFERAAPGELAERAARSTLRLALGPDRVGLGARLSF